MQYTKETIQRETEQISQMLKDADVTFKNEKDCYRIIKAVKEAMEHVARQKAIDIKNMIETL